MCTESDLTCCQSAEIIWTLTQEISQTLFLQTKMPLSRSQINLTHPTCLLNSACLKICLSVPFLLFPAFPFSSLHIILIYLSRFCRFLPSLLLALCRCSFSTFPFCSILQIPHVLCYPTNPFHLHPSVLVVMICPMGTSFPSQCPVNYFSIYLARQARRFGGSGWWDCPWLRGIDSCIK